MTTDNLEGKNNTSEVGSGVEIEKTEGGNGDIKEILAKGADATNKAVIEIASNLEQAKGLQKKNGPEAEHIVDQIEKLQQEVKEEQAAFDARAERLSSPYVLSPELAKVLKVSRVLKRPLLIEGEPGTGKTALAYALAGNENLPIVHAQCKSTTTAQDLLYNFDVVKRLQDAQLGKDVSDLRQYVHYGPLGKAFASQEQVILLIDEVDKAKRDFSNDLLHELDQMAFFIPETGEEVAAKKRPIVIITSNRERDLPEPFRRRCVYSVLEFPKPDQMAEIVRAHIPDVGEKLLESALKRFYEIRQAEGLEKKPSTSEMLDWIKVLKEFGVDEVGDETPYPETLLKYESDLHMIAWNNKEQELREARMPESVIAALNGEKVVKIWAEGGSKTPAGNVYSLLANKGYKFITQKDSYDNNDEERLFKIEADGVRRVDEYSLIFSFDSDKHEIYSILKENNLIKSEFIVSNDPIKFTRIIESNDLFVEGKDDKDQLVYKTSDGKFVFEKDLTKEEKVIDEEKKNEGSKEPRKIEEGEETRRHGDVVEHKHREYDYWHPVDRPHKEHN